MGVALAKRVQVFVWPRLGRRDDVAARVLMAMAMTARDSDANPLYFGGSDALVMACGYDVQDESGQRAVRRALDRLKRLGYVERLAGTPQRWNRRWILNIPGLDGLSPPGSTAELPFTPTNFGTGDTGAATERKLA